jgi:uroporphyrinogen-III synthase
MRCFPAMTMMKTKTKLFFSGTVSESGPLKTFCAENGWELTAKSLLRFEAVPFSINCSFDVIFFSSPRSLDYFISHSEIPPNVQLACIGKGTAEALKRRNLIPNFIGESSGDPEKVAAAFSAWLGNRHVLFPLAKQSNETIARVIPESQKTIVRCYETQLVETDIPPQDIYVFTSPSNLKAFLISNIFPFDSQIIAWGKTTDKKIVELSFKSKFVLDESTEESLVQVLKTWHRSA